MRKNMQLNPLGDGLAFLEMISWGCYSALIKKIGEWEYPIVAVTRRVYFYGILFLIPVLIQQKASGNPRQFPVSGASWENDHGLSGRCGTDIHWSGYFTEKTVSF